MCIDIMARGFAQAIVERQTGGQQNDVKASAFFM
jgi:hypothetical protein